MLSFKRILLVGTILLALILFFSYYTLKNIWIADLETSLEKKIEINVGDSVSSVARQLSELNIISNPRLFIVMDKIFGYPKQQIFIHGQYTIPKKTSLRQLSQNFRSGNIDQSKITFIEGWTVKKILEKLDNNLTSKEAIKPPIEGTLFPDTYQYNSNTSKQTIINNMKSKMIEVTDEIWANRDTDNILKSKEEMVILASIIEKETGRLEDMPIIASVFINRLRRGMRLESCPTVIYALSDGFGELLRPLLIKDLSYNHPYNTYRNKNLPPTAIANPGYNALKAAANPAKSEYLFFVSDGQGGTRFSKTFKDHSYKAQQLYRYNASQQ